MNVPALIAGLYPPSVQSRWGEAMRDDLAAAGPRGWANGVGGAIRLWLAPGDWPDRLGGQTRRLLLVALAGLIVGAGLAVRASTGAAQSLRPALDRPASALWLACLATGVLAALPMPDRAALRPRRAVALATRTLGVPALLLLVMAVTANLAPLGRTSPLGGVALSIWYWTTLGYCGLRACTLTARITRLARAPSARRLQLALGLVAAGLASAAAQLALSAAPDRLAALVCLSVLATLTLHATLDIRRARRRLRGL